MDSLQEILRGQIDGKKYLLVMDDVWNEDVEKWASLKMLLTGGAKGSKILITTRSKLVAEVSEATSPYILNGLSENNSWILFKKMAFKECEELKSPNMIEMGKEIAKKCTGVPLVIRTVGRLLYFKTSEAEWLSFKNNDLSTIAQKKKVITQTLKLSYNHLPSHLKPCFAYCSLFSKDHKFKKDELIQLWVAEGFVPSQGDNKCLEDVGNEYFMELIWRSFFQDVHRNKYGDVVGCKMHDLMHDLARLVAGTECFASDIKNVNERSRRILYDPCGEAKWSVLSTSQLKPYKLRTFASTGSLRELNETTLKAHISSLKSLRVLNLQDFMIKVPFSIGMLKHLRFLNLSGNREIQSLPCSITKLHNLQTLNLRGCVSLRELPNDISNLVNLKHLDLEECYSLSGMPRGLDKLTGLQTMNLFAIGSSVSYEDGGLWQLNTLINIRGSLRIRDLHHLRKDASQANTVNLKYNHVRALTLEWIEIGYNPNCIDPDFLVLEKLHPNKNVESMHINRYGGVRLSSWVSSLSNLIEISIHNCKRLQYVPRLDRLPNLQKLWLEGLNLIEYVGNNETVDEFGSSVFFPSLQSLTLWSMEKLKGFLPPYFHCLSCLSILGCPQLFSIPSPNSSLTKLDRNYSNLEAFKGEVIGSASPEDDTQQEALDGRDDLHSEGVPKPATLPEGSQHLTALQSLSVDDCNDLIVLPDWICDLTSLQVLEIFDCPKLTSLPDSIRRLSSLSSLTIGGCSRRLEERCTQQIGEDWSKIAHVKHIKVTGDKNRLEIAARAFMNHSFLC